MKNKKTPSLFSDEENQAAPKGKPTSAGNPFGTPKLKPIDRRQMIFRSVEIEKLVPENHEVRAIWEFVGRLNLSRYYDDIRSEVGAAGRAAWDPQLMVSLWIYSYGKGVCSAREIARLCDFDPAYQWLTGLTVINHHSLSDFRVDHKEALDLLLIDILAILSLEGLVTLERVAQDGTKIKANASGKHFRREDTLREHLQLAKEQIAAAEALQESDVGSLRQQKAAERAARERKEKIEKALAELEPLRNLKKKRKDQSEARASMTDPEARIMKQGNGGFGPSYNVQISTDSANGLIVAVGVSQLGNDTQELIPAIERIQDVTEETPQQMVFDAGYTTKANIIEADKRGIDVFGSFPETVGMENIGWRGENPKFELAAFTYNSSEDTYTCPGGETMRLRVRARSIGHMDFHYLPNLGTCQKCRFQKECCPQNSRKGRAILRKVDAPEIAAFKKKMETDEAKAIYKERSQLAEFPNAWIKEKIGLRQFSVRGLVKVKMEALWACITYNVQRWIGLQWRSQWAINEG